jgi:hypothetical protein
MAVYKVTSIALNCLHMKPAKSITTTVVVFLFALSFAGCRKGDQIELKNICRIASMNVYLDQVLAPRFFIYNAKGDPVEVRFQEELTGTPTFKFWYDAQGRLAGYSGYQDHSYTYDQNGNAVIDSIESNYAGGGFRYADKLFYDKYGRVIRSEKKLFQTDIPNFPGVGNTVITHYEYDKRGNLVKPGVTYDSKPSMIRTSKVWMLIEKDYSVNNPVYASMTYNEFGFPVRPGPRKFLDYVVDLVNYDCGRDFGNVGK